VETYRTEDEQLAALKRWWKENGKSLVVGVLLAIAAVFGWQNWQASQQAAGEAASEIYFNLIEAVALNSADQTSTVMHLAEQLQSEHASLTYAQYGALLAAKQAVDNSDFEQAEKQLNWAVDNADKTSSVYKVALLRLARVIAAQGGEEKQQRALAMIENVDAGAHKASFEEVKGDLYLSLGREADARNAYQTAVDAVEGQPRLVLNLKLNDLAVAGER
jgi:predicted negative regulator of RcsB-dependent stress response